MSWFDTAGLTSFAKSALSTAQKTIDKALDIKEDNIAVAPTISRTDVDGFFEAFGLGSKNAQSKLIAPKLPIEEEPSTSSHTLEQGTGFWTDTWGSFFEANKSLSEVQEDSPNQNVKPPISPLKTNSNQKSSESAVSSQPVRSSLFPESVRHSASQERSANDVVSADCSKTLSLSSEVTDTTTCQPSTSLSKTVQENSFPELPLESDSDQFKERDSKIDPSIAESCNTLLEPVSLQNVGNPVESNDDVPEAESVDDAVTITHVSANYDDSLKANSKSEYDVVDLHEKCLEEAYEVTDSASRSEERFSHQSTSEAEKLCSAVQESYVDLESKEVSQEIAVTCPDASNDQLSSTVIPQIQLDNQNEMSFNDSFHILNSCIVHNVNDWVTGDGIRHLMDSARESESAEEGNSRSGGDTQSNSSKDESETDVKECEVKSSCSGGSQEMSGSFVRCSIEEADCSSHRGQSPLSTTTSEQSDGTKLESEQNTSGDEVETATSSDIEILSAPNGENSEKSSSQAWVPRILRVRRSESPSSDCSKDNSMPVVQEGEELKPSSERSSAFHHKKAFIDMDMNSLSKQQEELQALLEVREKKTLELSQENVKLQETLDILQNELQEAKIAKSKDSQMMSSLTKECMQRLAQMESQLLKVSKERDSMRNQLDEIESEMVQRVKLTELDEIIKEKDQQIKELMEEGEKLSKKELTHSTIIKKLRAKEDDMEHTIKSLKEKLDENSKEVDRLRKSLGAKDDQEKKHIDAIRQLTTTLNKQEKEIISLKSRLEDSIEKDLSQKRSLEGTYTELTELRKSCSAKDIEIQKLTLSVEMAAKEKLREGAEQANKEKEALLLQIDNLRSNMQRNEEDSNRRELHLKEDIARLQIRLQEFEDQNENLTKNLSTATRPVVRQMEILQASYNAQVASSEKVERNLTDKLNDTQRQLTLCLDKERIANEKCMKMSLEFAKLESENASLREEKFKLISEISGLNSQLSTLEESSNRDLESVNNLKQNFALKKSKLEKEKAKLSNELQKVCEHVKELQQQNQNLQDEIKLKEYKIQSMGNLSPNSSPNASLRSSVDSINNWIQDEVPERRLSTPINNYRMSVYDSLRSGCAASILENLQSQLKQREGEIAQLQYAISKLERERESIAQELVEVSTQNETLQQNLDSLLNVEKAYKELKDSHTVLLQMYGEKDEQYQELKLDLADVKSMYKAQLEELLQNK